MFHIEHTEMRPRLQFILVLLAVCAQLSAQDPARHPVNGRPYAGVMDSRGAPWLERTERENEERPRLAVRLLRVQAGMQVADIGAGSGYYSELLSSAVGATGRVYAVDIQPGMIRLIEERVHRQNLRNVTPVLGSVTDPKLPESSLDLALLVDVYHEFAEPRAMLRRIRSALRPDGRLVLLEFRKEDPAVPIRAEHKMSVEEAKIEIEPEGYRLDAAIEDLPWQHILIFRKTTVH
jgi:ubiquinone/menaquinone biosynthesis C-methylase UbiE